MTLLGHGGADAAHKDLLLGEDMIAGGLVLANHTINLGVRVTVRCEGIDRVALRADADRGRIALGVQTKPFDLAQGSGVTLRQTYEILRDLSDIPSADR